MSAYNTVNTDEVCPKCGKSISRPVQFKYGGVWQRAYSIGDRLVWNGNNVGEPGRKRVRALGYPDKCPNCGFRPDWTYDVEIEEDIIQTVLRREPRTEAERYRANSHYVVVES